MSRKLGVIKISEVGPEDEIPYEEKNRIPFTWLELVVVASLVWVIFVILIHWIVSKLF